jgi:hypothetical protein
MSTLPGRWLEKTLRRSPKSVQSFANVVALYCRSIPRIRSLGAPLGHFYSPVVNPHDEHVQAVAHRYEASELADGEDLSINHEEMLATLDRLSRFYPELPFAAAKTEPWRYFYENGAFSYGDAITYFCQLRQLRPRRVIEIGSGFSSCLLMDVNDRFFLRSIETHFIEPYPKTLLGLMAADDFYHDRIIAKKVQNVPTSFFKQLQENDILFIDSSHVAKTGSDVNDYLFRILPALERGVVVHIHDIPYPFEYGPEWVTEENRSWNEAYALHAFLQYNQAFQITYFNHLVYRHYRELLREKMPLCAVNCGASLWLRKS